jgi:splicing factor 3B subunit 3
VIIGSDSGKVSIVEYDATTNNWKLVHCEVYGKTGCRRIVPGQLLAADPKGRAFMLAAIEKQKLVYVLNRDTSNKLTISSPLEAHKGETIVFSMCGVDVGFDNPIFALIELEYAEVDQDPTGDALQETEKKLSYYELDLGLNHVVRKWSEPISRTANFLLSVPGGETWPSGVLICGENWVSYKHQGHVEIRAPLPRRYNIPAERGVLITAGALHKQKDLFFFVLQSEFGDLYKVSFDLDPNDTKLVLNITVAVFDTIQPANSLCILKTGFLYSASEFGNHFFYQFQGLDDSNAVKSSKITDEALNEELGDDSISASKVAPVFKPSNKLANLLIADQIHSLAPITDMIVTDLFNEDANQIYTVCGKNVHSTLRTLRHGISVSEVASIDLPGKANSCWTIKRNQDDEHDAYIIVSFSTSTLVLSIGETIEEVTDSGFLTNTATLQVALLADNAMIQVYNNGIRHIRPNNAAPPTEWKPPPRRSIQLASVNARQVAISLSGGEIIYFELDEAGQLVEMGTTDMGREISCLDIGIIPEGRMRSMFLAVGCWDDTYQLLSLDPSDILGKGQIFPIDSRPTAISFVEMVRETSPEETNNNNKPGTSSSNLVNNTEGVRSLYLNIGLEKGVIIRVAVDQVSGDLSDPRSKFLGPKAVKLCRLQVSNQPCTMALSTRSWLLYNFENRYHQDPLSYDGLESVADVSSEMFTKGIVGVTGNSLKIFSIDNFGGSFNQIAYPLRYTPKKFLQLPKSNDFLIIESDPNEYNEEETNQINEQYTTKLSPEDQQRITQQQNQMETSNAEEEDESDRTVLVKGPIPGTEGKWGSGIRIIDGKTGVSKSFLQLTENEAAFSCCTCRFTHHSEETFIVVGTAKDLQVSNRRFSTCFIHVYRLLEDTLQLIHKTEVEDIPQAMMEFQGKLLVGIGRSLRLYELGKKKLLKKSENKSFPTYIIRLQAMGDRIYVGDLAQSVFFVKYRKSDNLFGVFADDTLPR